MVAVACFASLAASRAVTAAAMRDRIVAGAPSACACGWYVVHELSTVATSEATPSQRPPGTMSMMSSDWASSSSRGFGTGRPVDVSGGATDPGATEPLVAPPAVGLVEAELPPELPHAVSATAKA